MSRGHDKHTTTPSLTLDMKRPEFHLPEHFFQGVCICTCRHCTKTSGNRDKPYCICTDCPAEKCGIKMKGL